MCAYHVLKDDGLWLPKWKFLAHFFLQSAIWQIGISVKPLRNVSRNIRVDEAFLVSILQTRYESGLSTERGVSFAKERLQWTATPNLQVLRFSVGGFLWPSWCSKNYASASKLHLGIQIGSSVVVSLQSFLLPLVHKLQTLAIYMYFVIYIHFA